MSNPAKTKLNLVTSSTNRHLVKSSINWQRVTHSARAKQWCWVIYSPILFIIPSSYIPFILSCSLYLLSKYSCISVFPSSNLLKRQVNLADHDPEKGVSSKFWIRKNYRFSPIHTQLTFKWLVPLGVQIAFLHLMSHICGLLSKFICEVL